MRYLEEEKNIIDINKEIVQEYIMFTRNRGKYSFVASIDGMIKANIDKRSDIGEQVSDATLNNYLRNIKVFFYWLDENHIIKKNTVCKCKFLKTERKSKEQLTDEKFKKLTRSINITKFHEYRDFVINLIMDTGMRLSETLHLTINDVDFSRRTILIPAEINKGRKDRVIFYGNTISKLLHRWIRFKDIYQETELLFPTHRTNTILRTCDSTGFITFAEDLFHQQFYLVKVKQRFRLLILANPQYLNYLYMSLLYLIKNNNT